MANLLSRIKYALNKDRIEKSVREQEPTIRAPKSPKEMGLPRRAVRAGGIGLESFFGGAAGVARPVAEKLTNFIYGKEVGKELAKQREYETEVYGEPLQERYAKQGLTRARTPLEEFIQGAGYEFPRGYTGYLTERPSYQPKQETRAGKVGEIAGGLYGMFRGAGRAFYSPVEKAVRPRIASRFPEYAGRAGKWLTRGVSALGAEAVSSAVASPIRAYLRGEPIERAYGEELATGVISRGIGKGVSKGLNIGAKGLFAIPIAFMGDIKDVSGDEKAVINTMREELDMAAEALKFGNMEWARDSYQKVMSAYEGLSEGLRDRIEIPKWDDLLDFQTKADNVYQARRDIERDREIWQTFSEEAIPRDTIYFYKRLANLHPGKDDGWLEQFRPTEAAQSVDEIKAKLSRRGLDIESFHDWVKDVPAKSLAERTLADMGIVEPERPALGVRERPLRGVQEWMRMGKEEAPEIFPPEPERVPEGEYRQDLLEQLDLTGVRGGGPRELGERQLRETRKYQEMFPRIKQAIEEPISKIEQKAGGIGGMRRIRKNILDMSEDIAEFARGGELEEEAAREPGLRGMLSKFTFPAYGGGKLAGAEKYAELSQQIKFLSQRAATVLNESFNKVLGPLSKEEKLALPYLLEGAPVKEGEVTDAARNAAEYISRIFDEHVLNTNIMRRLNGQDPISGIEDYFPHILREEFRRAAEIGEWETGKFWRERTRGMSEFLAGLFDNDIENVLATFAQRTEQFTRKDMYSLLEQYKGEYGNVGRSFINSMEKAYGLSKRRQYEPGIFKAAFGNTAKAIERKVNSLPFMQKDIEINEQAQEVLKTTSFYKENPEFAEMVDNGVIETGRYEFGSVAEGILLPAVYSAKLGLNFSFHLLNSLQNLGAIPQVGFRNMIKGQARTLKMLFPLIGDSAQKEHYVRILKEASADNLHRDALFGANLFRKLQFIMNTVETNNRLTGLLGAEEYLKGKGVESRAARQRAAAAFSEWAHLGGRMQPSASRTLPGKAAYMFRKYALNYSNMLWETGEVAFKEEGVRDFWKKMAKRGGVDNKLMNEFDNLPKSSKAAIARLLAASAVGYGLVNALTQSQFLAKRMLFWNQMYKPEGGLKGVLIDPMQASLAYIADPSNKEKRDKMVSKWEQTFSWEFARRLTDFLDAEGYGYVRKRDRPGFQPQYGVPEDTASKLRLLLFGRTTLPEYGVTSRQWKRGAKEQYARVKIYDELFAGNTEKALQLANKYGINITRRGVEAAFRFRRQPKIMDQWNTATDRQKLQMLQDMQRYSR